MGDVRKFTKEIKTVVIKVGSSTLTNPITDSLDDAVIGKLTREISHLMKNEKLKIILVTSGAVSAGKKELADVGEPLPDDPSMPQKQVASGAGIELYYKYKQHFKKCGIVTIQVLLSALVLKNRKTRKNIKATFQNIFSSNNMIAIVNENDIVATEELKIGDNDQLSALVAKHVNADLLILLSDIDGLYDADPKSKKSAKLIPIVNDWRKVKKFAGKAGSKYGTGGMKTKIKAARTATTSGIDMVIANSNDLSNISKIIKGENIGTLFLAKEKGIFTDLSEKRKIHKFMKSISDGCKNRFDKMKKAL